MLFPGQVNKLINSGKWICIFKIWKRETERTKIHYDIDNDDDNNKNKSNDNNTKKRKTKKK